MRSVHGYRPNGPCDALGQSITCCAIKCNDDGIDVILKGMRSNGDQRVANRPPFRVLGKLKREHHGDLGWAGRRFHVMCLEPANFRPEATRMPECAQTVPSFP
jgi:hypothetical protein